MNGHLILLVLAVVCFLVGAIDHPPVSSGRMIALGLLFLTLAQFVLH